MIIWFVVGIAWGLIIAGWYFQNNHVCTNEPVLFYAVPKIEPEQGLSPIEGKRSGRLLETSLIGGPWENLQ